MSLTEKDIELVLRKIIARPDLHARWLNTLSFLEHVGSRKILKTQSGSRTDEKTLRHAAEEAGHAYHFKKMISQVTPDASLNYSYDSMLCGYAAYRYFQGLDSRAKKSVTGVASDEKARICYLYVTTMVEERAGWIYPIYDRCLRDMGTGLNLARVIAEEERHLDEMHQAISVLKSAQLEEFRRFESESFARFFEILRHEVENATEVKA